MIDQDKQILICRQGHKLSIVANRVELIAEKVKKLNFFFVSDSYPTIPNHHPLNRIPPILPLLQKVFPTALPPIIALMHAVNMTQAAINKAVSGQSKVKDKLVGGFKPCSTDF
jgi:hypothetical protein